MKQSYTILSWFYYLNFSLNKSKKNQFNLKFLPKKKKNFTFLKPPMAHKTFSKEQIVFFFYNFKVNIYFNLSLDYLNILNINNLLYLILLIKKNFPNFETNLFFLKNYTYSLSFKEKLFFNYK